MTTEELEAVAEAIRANEWHRFRVVVDIAKPGEAPRLVDQPLVTVFKHLVGAAILMGKALSKWADE